MTANRQLSAVADDPSAVIPPCSSADGQNAFVSTSSSETIQAMRRHLPDERRALTHHFSVAGHEGYLTVGVYEDGRPGELFITMAKEYGVPLQVLCSKFAHMRFEPSGWSGNPKIGYAKSIVDYVLRWLELKFLNCEQGELIPPMPSASEPTRVNGGGDVAGALSELIEFGDAPACTTCGSLMLRNGSCYRCATCGSTSGCS